MSEELAAVDTLSVPLKDQEITYKTLQVLHGTPTVPKRYRESPTGVQDMLAAVLHGREMGVGAMESIDKLFLVNGQKSMFGTLMCAQIYRNHHKIKVVVKPKAVTVIAYRRDPWTHEFDEQGEWTFSDADAKKAYLDSKDTYEEYPQLMWAWRAISAVSRIYFADCLAGIGYTPEEVGLVEHPEPLPDFVELEVDGVDLDVQDATVVVKDVFPEAEVVMDREVEGMVQD